MVADPKNIATSVTVTGFRTAERPDGRIAIVLDRFERRRLQKNFFAKNQAGFAMSIPRIYTDETGPVDRMDEP